MPILSLTQKEQILKNAKNIVIVGLSPNKEKTSHQIAQFLITKGYEIIPVYPRGGEIMGKQSFSTLKEALENMSKKQQICDIINIFRKSEALEAIMSEICDCLSFASLNNHLCVWAQLGLHNKKAQALAKQHHIMYEENSCIKRDYEYIFTR